MKGIPHVSKFKKSKDGTPGEGPSAGVVKLRGIALAATGLEKEYSLAVRVYVSGEALAELRKLDGTKLRLPLQKIAPAPDGPELSFYGCLFYLDPTLHGVAARIETVVQ